MWSLCPAVPATPGNSVLSAWEDQLALNTGAFVYLDVSLAETFPACNSSASGEYPFLHTGEDGRNVYVVPLHQPETANYMSRMMIPISDAAEALLSDGFLDFEGEAILQGSGVFFVDLMDDPHSGPLYRLVPAPYSVETAQMLTCTRTISGASGLVARTLGFVRHCMTGF